MMSDLPRPDLERILRALNKKFDSVLSESDLIFLEKCLTALHAGRKAVLIVAGIAGGDTISWLFSGASRAEATHLMHKVIEAQIRGGD